MKSSVLIVWNVVLSILVIVLLYQQYGNKKPAEVTPQTTGTAPLRVAYINTDTLENHYQFFSDKKKELDAKQQELQDKYNKKLAAFQNDYQSAQKASATMTQDELKKTSDKLQGEQNDIQQMQNDLQSEFQSQLEAFNLQLKDSLDFFLKAYNSEKKYDYIFSVAQGSNVLIAGPQYDITNEAIKGMNDRLKKP